MAFALGHQENSTCVKLWAAVKWMNASGFMWSMANLYLSYLRAISLYLSAHPFIGSPARLSLAVISLILAWISIAFNLPFLPIENGYE